MDLTDRTYDGREEGGHLSRGLGQLVDGRKGADNFRLDVSGNGKGEYTIISVYLCKKKSMDRKARQRNGGEDVDC